MEIIINTNIVKDKQRWEEVNITIRNGLIYNSETKHIGLLENIKIIKPTKFRLEEIINTNLLKKDLGFSHNIIYNNWRDSEYKIPVELSKIELIKLKWINKSYLVQENIFLKDLIILILGAILGYLIKS